MCPRAAPYASIPWSRSAMSDPKHQCCKGRFSASPAVRPPSCARTRLTQRLEPKRDAAREIHALQVIGNILLETISKDIALHRGIFVLALRQPAQTSAQRHVPAEVVFGSVSKSEC